MGAIAEQRSVNRNIRGTIIMAPISDRMRVLFAMAVAAWFEHETVIHELRAETSTRIMEHPKTTPETTRPIQICTRIMEHLKTTPWH